MQIQMIRQGEHITIDLPDDPVRVVAEAATRTHRETGQHPEAVIVGWRLYLALSAFSDKYRHYAMGGERDHATIERILHMRVTVDPASPDRIQPVLDPMATAMRAETLARCGT